MDNSVIEVVPVYRGSDGGGGGGWGACKPTVGAIVRDVHAFRRCS